MKCEYKFLFFYSFNISYGIYVCLRLNEGYSCIVHLQHCWRKITELALRAWKKENVWVKS